MSHDPSSDVSGALRVALRSVAGLRAVCTARALNLRKLDRAASDLALKLAELRMAIRAVTLRRVKR